MLPVHVHNDFRQSPSPPAALLFDRRWASGSGPYVETTGQCFHCRLRDKWQMLGAPSQAVAQGPPGFYPKEESCGAFLRNVTFSPLKHHGVNTCIYPKVKQSFCERKLFQNDFYWENYNKMYSTKLTISHSICSELTPQKISQLSLSFCPFCYIQKALLLIK